MVFWVFILLEKMVKSNCSETKEFRLQSSATKERVQVMILHNKKMCKRSGSGLFEQRGKATSWSIVRGKLLDRPKHVLGKLISGLNIKAKVYILVYIMYIVWYTVYIFYTNLYVGI